MTPWWLVILAGSPLPGIALLLWWDTRHPCPQCMLGVDTPPEGT